LHTAILSVDRWYKGTPGNSTEQIRYAFPPIMIGHACIDLRRSSSWLIFAHRVTPDMLEFSHDCEGGLPMSGMLAPDRTGSWAERLQQDLIAGLKDSDPAVRLANIARLGDRSAGDRRACYSNRRSASASCATRGTSAAECRTILAWFLPGPRQRHGPRTQERAFSRCRTDTRSHHEARRVESRTLLRRPRFAGDQRCSLCTCLDQRS